MTWPAASIGDVELLHVLAAGLPGVVVHERHLDHPFDDVWPIVTDFEGAVPAFEPDVVAARVLGRDGDRLDLAAKGPWWMAGRWVRFDVELRPGWCWMVARRPPLYVVGMAAEPDGGGTRFAHLEGLVVPAPRWARRAVTPVLWLSRLRHRHHVPRDADRIERVLRHRLS